MDIWMEKTTELKKEGTKTVWVKQPAPAPERITETQYNNIVDAMPFFRRVGGSETASKEYTAAGYKVTQIISTSPDKHKRSIYKFEFKQGAEENV